MTEKEKKRREKLLREKIQKLRLLDDEFMSKVFEDESQNLRTEQPAQQRICRLYQTICFLQRVRTTPFT